MMATIMEMVASIMEMVALIVGMVALTMEIVASIMEMGVSIVETVVTIMEMVETIMVTGVGGITQDLMLEMVEVEAMEFVIVATIMVMAKMDGLVAEAIFVI